MFNLVLESQELLTVVALSIMGGFGLILANKLIPQFTKNKRKSPKETTPEELVKAQVRQIQENYAIQETNLRKQNQALQNKVNRIQGLYDKVKAQQLEDEEEEEEENDNILSEYDIDWQKALQVGGQLGLQTQNFDPNNIALKEYATEKILENADLAKAFGVLVKRGTVGTAGSNQQTGVKQDFVDATVEEIVKSGGHLA